MLIVGRAYRLPDDPSSVKWDKVKKRYFTIVGLEMLAIILVTNIVAALGRADLIWPSIAVIVGLHFIPLARVFASPIYYVTAAVLTSLGLATPTLPNGSAQLLLGVGAALTLWATALVTEPKIHNRADLLTR